MIAQGPPSCPQRPDTPPPQARDPYYRLRPAPLTPPDQICSCAPAQPIMLMSALSENPLHCLDCNLEVEPASLPLPAALTDPVAHWAWIAGAIHTLELDSGPYEAWAQAELLNLASPVNQEGLKLRHALDLIRRCYYVLFQQIDHQSGAFSLPGKCPACSGPFSSYSTGRIPRLLCEACSLVLVNP